MHICGAPADVRPALHSWFSSPLGRSIHALELNRLRDILPRLYGPVAVQIGRPGGADLLDASLATTRVVLDHPPTDVGSGSQVWGEAEALPLDSKSVHTVVLAHMLEFSHDPHQVLREVGRVLQPEGHVVVVGFNPFSLFGLRRRLGPRRGCIPWCGHFLSVTRVRDWLALLDFEFSGGNMVYYRPPVQRAVLRDRLYFLERAGDRWWPFMAGVYILVARKREVGMTPIQPQWRQRKKVTSGLAEPATKGMKRGAS